MKKIVSLALSTAMALSMFASVTSAATLTTQEKYNALVTQGIFQGYPDGNAYLDKDMTRAEFAKVVALLTGLETSATGTNSYQDQNYANAWYKPFVEAVTKAGYMQGTTTGAKKLFNPNGKVTVQEMAATLVRAAKLEVPTTGINNTASAWAKGEVQAAINAGLISGTSNFTAAATRGLLVDTAYAYQTAVSAPTVASYEVSNNGSTVVFTLSNGEKVTVDLTTPLVANQATNVKFTYDGREYTHSVTYTVTTATQATGATATNLKEVDVAFNGTVDEATASDVSNYSTTAGRITSATVQPDGKTVRLVVADRMTNQESYTVTVTGVKAGTATINSSALSFRPLDNVLPTVTTVTGLGTKAVKVTFSEPVTNVNPSNFKINNTAFSGTVRMGATEREVILRPYTAFPVGTHTLTSELVTDYAGLRSVSANNEFTVANDVTGPVVTEVQATLERAVVTFDEEIDPDTVAASDFYWMDGTNRRTASSVDRIAGNKFAINFSEANRLPAGATSLYVDTVSDYSGNANTVKQFTVTATVDQTRPQVTQSTYNASSNTITVRFNKSVTAIRDNFRVTRNSNNDVLPIRDVVAGANNTYTISFYNATPAAADYTLRISGVQDTTALKNTIEPYTMSFTIGDNAAPTLTQSGITASNERRTITVTFNKAMDPATLTDRNNYAINFQADGASAATLRTLPSTVTLYATNNNRSVVLQFPERIENTRVSFATVAAPTSGSVKNIVVTGVKDTQGNILAGNSSNSLNVIEQAAGFAAYSSTVAASAVQTAPRTIKVRFNQAIDTVSPSDFTVTGTTVTGAVADGDLVTLTTSTDVNGDADVAVRANNGIRTVAGNSVAAASTTIADQNGPVVELPTNRTTLEYNSTTRTILLPFNEALAGPANDTLYANDLVVTNLQTNAVLTPGTQYTATVAAAPNDEQVTITIASGVTLGAEYSVKVKANAAYIQDTQGNKAAESNTFYTARPATNAPAPVLTPTATPAINADGFTNAPSVSFNTTAQDVSRVTVVKPGSTTEETYPLGTALTAEGKYTVVATNLSGNSSTPIEFTIDRTAPSIPTVAGSVVASSNTVVIKLTETNIDLQNNEPVVGFTVSNDVATPGTFVTVPASGVYNAANNTVTLTADVAGAFGPTGTIVRIAYNATNGNVEDKAGNELPTTTTPIETAVTNS